MAEVELLLPALPAHVRTARVVCVAAARRAGLADELVDELRLAVGEACARAVGLHARHAPDERVASGSRRRARADASPCATAGPAAGPTVDDVTGGLLDDGGTPDDDFVDPDVALALLLGLVDETEVDLGRRDRHDGDCCAGRCRARSRRAPAPPSRPRLTARARRSSPQRAVRAPPVVSRPAAGPPARSRRAGTSRWPASL